MATVCDPALHGHWRMDVLASSFLRMHSRKLSSTTRARAVIPKSITSMTKLCYTTTYLDDVDGVDEGHGDDGGSSGHADLLEKSRGGGGAGGHRPSVGREGGVGEAHLD